MHSYIYFNMYLGKPELNKRRQIHLQGTITICPIPHFGAQNSSCLPENFKEKQKYLQHHEISLKQQITKKEGVQQKQEGGNQKQKGRKSNKLLTMQQLVKKMMKFEERLKSNLQNLNFQGFYEFRQLRQDSQLILSRQSRQIQNKMQQLIEKNKKQKQKCMKELQQERQLLKQEKEELENERKQFLQQMKSMMIQMLEKEQEESKRQSQKKEAELNKIIEQKFKQETLNNQEQIEQITKRINLRVKEEKNLDESSEKELEVLKNKFADFSEKILPIINSKTIARFLDVEEEQRRKDKELEKFVNRTGCGKNYRIEGNSIMLEKQETVFIIGISYQLIILKLDMVVFKCRTHIKHSRKKRITLGLTDFITQQSNQRSQWEHSIQYDGQRGMIYYGVGEQGKEEYQTVETNDLLSQGMDVVMEVDRQNCTVTFTLRGDSIHYISKKEMQGTRQYQVQTPILNHPYRHFVPFYQMANSKDCITWRIH